MGSGPPSRSWSQLQKELRRLVFKRGVDEVAQEIPADRSTIYRLIGGDIKRPSLAIRARIETLSAEPPPAEPKDQTT